MRLGEHRVGERAERGGDGGLVAGLHVHVLGEEAADAGEARGDQIAGSVTLVERAREGLLARGQGVALPLLRVQLLAHGLDGRLLARDVGLRVLVGAGELGSALLVGLALRLAALPLGLRCGQPGARRVERVLLAEDLAADGRQPGFRGLGAAREPRDLEVVAGDERALGLDLLVERVERLPGRRGRLTRGRPARLRLGDERHQPGRLVTGLLHLPGRRARGGLGSVVGGSEEREPLLRERQQVAQPLLHLLEREGRASGTVHLVALLLLDDALRPDHRAVELLLQHHPLGRALLLGARVLRERTPEGHHLVGYQPRAGVSDDGRHGLRLPRDLRLPAERLELAADLPREVVESRQVGLHPLELAEGALLATAVLEDPGGLLDEAAPLLGRRAQDVVEPALADDDVHLASEPGVAQELLHVEQAAGRAVDRVLAAAVAEQRAADRDLGVVDGQRAVGVVDRERDLRAAERAARGRAGEDDVLHLAAAEGLGALLAHHPGEGVDDVRLAGSVRPDDAGHPGLELESGRLRERLEPLEGQALQVHARRPPRVMVPLTVPDARAPAGEPRAGRPTPPAAASVVGRRAATVARADEGADHAAHRR